MIQVSRLCAGIGCGGSADDASLSSSLIHDFLVAECSADSTDDNFNDDASPASAPGGDEDLQWKETATASLTTGEKKSKKEAERITTLLGKVSDRARLVLANHVSRASEEITELRPNRPAFRRALAGRLRAFGYDAEICHTSWPDTSEVAAGNYEYIDVIIAVTAGKATAAPGDNRYIVDVGFLAEFVVARPTGEYALVLNALPRVLVARPKEVKKVVNLAAKAARRSLKSQELAVPPWRKKAFMAAKWLGPHSRTANTAAGSCGSRGRDREATCCTVGFVLGPRLQPWQGAERGLA